MNYNLFQKTTIGKGGRAAVRWYYWFYDLTGRRIQKVCKGCKNKAEAIQYINSLPPLEKNNPAKIKTIAQDMFVPGSEHLKRREAMGRNLVEKTLTDYRHIALLIIETWGEIDIAELDIRDVTNYLINDSHSASWKQEYISVLEEIFTEAIWHNPKIQKPAFPHFSRKRNRKDVFTYEEIQTLFQQKNFENLSLDKDTAFLFFYCIFAAGLRLGEARALRLKQFIFDKNALIVDGFLRQGGERTTFNKAGSEEKQKFRIVPLPKDLMQQIRNYATAKEKSGEEFLFTYTEKPIRTEFAESTFKNIMKAAGIVPEERNLTPHSLRYTYVTIMRETVDGETIQKIVGHTKIEQTDYYTRPTIESGLAAVASAKKAVEHLLD